MAKALAYTQRTKLLHFKPKPRVVIPLSAARIYTYINTEALYSQPFGRYPLIWAELHEAALEGTYEYSGC